MTPSTRTLAALFASAVAACPLAALPVQAQDSAAGPKLEEVASFDHQVTGVTVSPDGRVFVNFPRWTEDAPISVGEVKDGVVTAYPDEAWNSWRNARKNEISAEDHFVSVQSVVADGKGSLWVLDPAAPASAFVVPKGPKLMKIDLATNKVAETYPVDTSVAPQGSYLNDVRFSPDGGHAYITDSGPIGALIVIDLKTKQARRLLSGHPTVQAEKDVVVKHRGAEIRRPDGRGVEFAADGIALSKDGETLFWQALTGKTLYAISTSLLEDPATSDEALAAAIKTRGENGVSDGLWLDGRDRMYISALEEDAIKRREGETVSTVLSDERLRWPDTFAEGPDGSIYVTASRIMDMNWYRPESPAALPTKLFKFKPE
ncbi:hypothetical protein ASG43_11375 [Aureimonas sp. Leaf454]|uniref:SMP-30/gluconolactonase/LRE family protein n=1 Tax=Aureimonas sp. Leaf454 TaxID=1736381 RepID=UPI0006FA1794|nr:L-dopachrome tautomerase-related protein [Aureimonas sp. Leaf454]KQT46233.1 hypothetical protein ASG43_11375 [Aureimonas sp. Leaf454]